MSDSKGRRGLRCAAFGCSKTTLDGVSLHTFPFDRSDILKKWVNFVQTKRKDWVQPSKYSVLCSDHFAEDCYPMKYRILESMGQSPSKKLLEKDAVPTIHKDNNTSDTPKRPSTGEVSCTPTAPKKTRMAFVKRENRRILQDFTSTVSSVENCTDVVSDEMSLATNTATTTEQNYDSNKENNSPPTPTTTRSVGCQLSLRRKQYKSHYVQTKFIGKSKAVQTNSPQFRDVGVTCNLLPSPEPSASAPMDNTDEFDDAFCSTPTHEMDTDESFSISESDELDSSTEDSFCSVDDGEEDGKFIVYEKNLLELFSNCPQCAFPTYGSIRNIKGSLLCVEQECYSCRFNRVWYSQPMVRSIPAGNLAISCALLYSGSLPTKLLRFLDFMKISSISYNTFMDHQNTYLQPTILEVWNYNQQLYIEEAQRNGQPLCLGGDGRSDSMGHSAKFGSYSLMDLDAGIIVDVKLVQSNEVKSSIHMEKEGLIRCIADLTENELVVGKLITDRHVQVKKWVRENMPGTQHCIDVWHVAKGLKKKLTKLSKEKDCENIQPWIKSLTNHLYWVPASTPDSDKDLMWQKWISVGNHIQNIHEGHGSQFPSCTHGPLAGSERRKRWLKAGSKACEKLEDVITSRQMKMDIPMLSTHQQTSDIEAYHSVINHFAPKMIGFSNEGQESRLLLAAMHFNENGNRGFATTADGERRYKVTFPKQKNGEYTIRKVKTESTYEYVDTLTRRTFEMAKLKRVPGDKPRKEKLPPLCSTFNHPNKAEAVSRLLSRFAER